MLDWNLPQATRYGIPFIKSVSGILAIYHKMYALTNIISFYPEKKSGMM